jgi:hypothetical protein
MYELIRALDSALHDEDENVRALAWHVRGTAARGLDDLKWQLNALTWSILVPVSTFAWEMLALAAKA